MCGYLPWRGDARRSAEPTMSQANIDQGLGRGSMQDASFLVSTLSALISSIALVGVAVGLLLQSRELKIARAQAFRATQAELIRMAVDDPSLLVAIGSALFQDEQLAKQNLYLNWRTKH